MKIINIIILVLAALQLIACSGAKERKAAYLEKADKALSSGDLDEARIDLKNVLQIDPKDARAYFMLGNVFEQKRNYSKAFSYFSQASQLDPENSEYQAKLGKFYLVLAGNIDKATEKMDLILSKDKNDVNGLLLKAGILLKQNKIQDAKTISEDILKNHPNNIENVILLSSLFDIDNDYKNAIQILEKAIEQNPGNQRLPNLLANSFFLDKNYDKAEKIFKSILSAHPNSFINYVTLANFYQKTNRPDKAEETLREAISADQKDEQRKISLVQYIKQIKGNDAAINELKSMINKYPDESGLRLALAAFQITSNNINAAIATYKKTVDDFSEEEAGITARVNLAKLYMQKQNVKEAKSIIDDAFSISPNDTGVNLVKGKISIYNKKYEQAITSLRTVIKNAPDNIEAYVLLSNSHRAINELDQAKDVMDRAYENNRDNIKAISELTRYYLQTKNMSGAEKVIDDYLKLDPKNYEALSIKASILNTSKKYSESEALAKNMIDLYPDKDNGYIQSVPGLLSNMKFDEAIKLLNVGYKKTHSVQLLKLISQVQMHHGKPADAVAALKSVNDNSNDESVQLLLAKAYVQNNDYDSAEKVLLASINADKTRAESYLYLATLYQLEKRPEKSVSILNKGIVANPESVILSATLAGFYEKSRDFDNAINVYESILALTPDNIVIRNNLASLLVDYKGDLASIERAKQLIKKLKDSNQPVILDTVGWVYYKSGDYSNSINTLKKVVDAMPDIQVFNYHLGMAYYKSGDKANAKAYLTKALDKKTSFDGIDIARDTLKKL